MARDLADEFPLAAAALEAASSAVGAGDGPALADAMFDGPAETLTLTHYAQPALFAHGAALMAVLGEALAGRVVAAAGHSLGEFTAYHAAHALSVADGARLVRTRGELMYRTGIERPGAMAAILGTLAQPVEAVCAEASVAGTVVAANFNADEQVVLSGEVAAVEKAMEVAKAAGAKRAVRLAVSGAFHSPLMEPAVPGLADALDRAAWTDPRFPIYANVDAEPTRTAAAARERLLQQLTAPVRWTSVVRRLAADHPGVPFVELGPGNVLTGLVRRIVPGADARACGTAAEVHELLSWIGK